MKKIVSAVALTALAFSAFAADFAITSQVKFQPTAAQWTIYSQSGKDTDSVYASLPDAKDTISIKVSEGPVTITGKLDVTKKDSASDWVNAITAALKLGNATLTAGRFESRYTNAVTADQNDLSFIGQNFAAPAAFGNKKLGANASVVGSKVGVDSDQVAGIQGTKNWGVFIADYTIADPLPGKLLLKAAVKSNKVASTKTVKLVVGDDGKFEEDSTAKNDYYTVTYTPDNTGVTASGWGKVPAAFAFETAYSQDGVGTIDFIANLDGNKVASFGLFYNALKVVDNLGLVIGGTYGFDSHDKDAAHANGGARNIAADLRVRYAINEQLSAGVYANFTNWKKNKDEDAYNAIDAVVNGTYKVNDIAKVFAEVEFSDKTLDSDKRKSTDNTRLSAQLGAIFTPAKGATLGTAVQLGLTGLGADADSNKKTIIQIPFSFNLSL